MNEWDIRFEIAEAVQKQLKKSGKSCLEAVAARAFLKSYTASVLQARQVASGNRTKYADAVESALCEAVQHLNLKCEKQPLMRTGRIEKKPKRLDLLVWKENGNRAVAIEVKGSANDFDNIASGLMEFFLARSTKATIGSGEFNAAATHFILVYLYGDNDDRYWFDLIVKKLFSRGGAKPEQFSIFGKKAKEDHRKDAAKVANDLCMLFRSIALQFQSD